MKWMSVCVLFAQKISLGLANFTQTILLGSVDIDEIDNG
jgi:hypothetical protein